MAALGTGVIILIVIWSITLAVLTLFTFVQSPIRFVGLAALLIATIITLVLGLLPRGTDTRAASSSTDPSNAIGLIRILLLTFFCITFLVGLVFVFLLEVFPPIYAQPIRKRYVR